MAKEISILEMKIKTAWNAITSGFVGLAAKADGLYQKLSGGTEKRILTTDDNYLTRTGGTLTPTTAGDVVEIATSGNKANGSLYVRSTSTNARGTLARVGFYSYWSMDSSGQTFWAFGARYDGVANQWVRMYTSSNNYLPYINFSTANIIAIGCATSNLTTNANPTMGSCFIFDLANRRFGIGVTPSTDFDVIGSARIRTMTAKYTDSYLLVADTNGLISKVAFNIPWIHAIGDSSFPATGYTQPTAGRTVNNVPTAYIRVFSNEFKQLSAIGISGYLGPNYGDLMTIAPYASDTASGGGGAMQLAFNAGGASDIGGLIFVRNGIDSTWNEWGVIYTSHNLNKSTVNFACNALTASGTVTFPTLSAAGLVTNTEAGVLGTRPVSDFNLVANTVRKLANFYADAGNTGTSATDAFSYTLAANMLSANGQTLEIVYAGTSAINTNSKIINVYFGTGTTGDFMTSSSSSETEWGMRMTIIRVSSTELRYQINYNWGARGGQRTASWSSLNLVSNSYDIKLKLTGGATNDIVAKMGSITWYPAAS